ncbi:MAG: cyclic nucleotide-binding domain-containing protein [Proteobacteria bacterium]|nr:cyclic nucleotide-binding domain-containing protein [Pseudomonadota bacterium]
MNKVSSRWQEDKSLSESYFGEDSSLCGGYSLIPYEIGSTGCGPVFEFFGCWFDLYKDMSTEELGVFNSILQSRTYDRETALMTQGMVSDRLYFINKGHVKTIFNEKGARLMGASMGMGDITGVETFFGGGLSKRSVLAEQGTRVDFLEKDDVLELFAHVPGLIGKLKSFCLKRKNDMHAIQLSTMEKRAQKRYAVSGLTAAKILDTEGIPTGKPFRGELLDISPGGFSFNLRLTEENMAQRLQGRSIVSLLKIHQSRPGEDVFWGGRIVKVCRRSGLNYSVHLKGDVTSSHVSSMLENLCD